MSSTCQTLDKTCCRVGSSLLDAPTLDSLYYITPALDRYVMLLDRTPCTQTMMSLNICGTDFYDLWHPHSHLLQFTSICPFFFHLDCFCPSQPPADKAYPWLIPMK